MTKSSKPSISKKLKDSSLLEWFDMKPKIPSVEGIQELRDQYKPMHPDLQKELMKSMERLGQHLHEKELDKLRFNFVRQALRRASYRWPARSEAIKEARVERGIYKCNACKERMGRKEFHLDHVEPVIRTDLGFTTWGEYILRLLPGVPGWQVLCTICHTAKTRIELEERKAGRKGRK